MNNNIRLYKLIHDEDTVDNILTIYKNLKGKENLEKRLFLKTLVYCALNSKISGKWMAVIKPELFFRKENFYETKLKSIMNQYKQHTIISFYGKRPNEEFGKIM